MRKCTLKSINLPERITMPAKTNVQLEPQSNSCSMQRIRILNGEVNDDSIATVTEDGLVMAGKN